MRKHPSGFTLVEVLVAILVFSIGLLGIAGLLVSVIGRNQSSVYHSVGVSLANDIAERMRANSAAFSLAVPGDNKYTAELASATPGASVSCKGTSATCNPTAMAKYDATQWETLVHNVLPHGQGIVCFDASNTADDGELAADGTLSDSGCDGGASVVIKVLWDETRSGGRADGTSNTQRYVMVFRP